MIDLVDKSDVKYRNKTKTIYPKIDVKVLQKSLEHEKYIEGNDGYHRNDIERNHEYYENYVKLPTDTLANVDIDDISKIGYCCGIYVLITRSGGTYIGSSTNIKRRLSKHRTSREYILDPIESVIIYVTANIRDAKYLEMNLIREAKPDLNRMLYTSTVYNIKDVMKNLLMYSTN